MNKIRTIVSKIFAFIYIFTKFHLKNKKPVANKRILVIFSGHLGNAIIGVDAVLELLRLYPVLEGWHINIVCSKSMWKLCCMIADMTGFEYIETDFPASANGTDFKTTKSVVKQINKMQYDKIIVTLAHNTPLAHYIVAAVRANESIGVFDDIEYKTGSLRYYFERAYTSKIKVPVDMHESVRLKTILQHLGDCEYKIKIHPISRVCDYNVPNENYVTVALDSMCTERRWEAHSFAELINLITEKFDYKICLTGGIEAETIYEEVIKEVKKPELIINYIGRTKMDEWMELLRGSEFHVGVDSGSIHVAASVGTQAFCLSGVWDGKRCMPYVLDEECVGTVNPVCIYREGYETLECYACKAQNARFGYGNDNCLQACREGLPCDCLRYIDAKKVFNTIVMNMYC